MNIPNVFSMPKSKLAASTILVIVLVLFSANSLFSQTTLCYPDCENDTWLPAPPNPPSTFQMVLPCGEPVVVSYRIRYACGKYWDLNIEEISFVNGYSGGESCGRSMNIIGMMENVIQQMLVQNPMGFPPTGIGQDSCANSYRIITGPCWSASFPIWEACRVTTESISDLEEPNLIGGGYLTPCSSENCCIQAFKVCVIGNQRIITYKADESVPGNCGISLPPDCKPICQ